MIAENDAAEDDDPFTAGGNASDGIIESYSG